MSSEFLEKWHIPLEKGFTEIDNGNSVQLHNQDGSRVIYLSIINASDKTGQPLDLAQKTLSTPQFQKEDNVWHFEGTRIRGNEVLVVVVTVTDEKDEEWARNFFKSIN